MKKLLVLLGAVMPLVAMAQYTGTGFYRIQNNVSTRYLAFVDNHSKGVEGTSVDVGLLNCWYGFEERVASSPATICYLVGSASGTTLSLDVEGQGIKLSSVTGGLLLKVRKNSSPVNTYTISGSQSGVSKFIADGSLTDDFGDIEPVTKAQATAGAGSYANWKIMPVDQANNYFGVKADVHATADNSYWSTLYTSIAVEPASSNTKAYVISRVAGEYAVLKEVTGIVPSTTPVLFRSTSASAADNKLRLYYAGGSSVGANRLVGNYYCNDIDDGNSKWPHRNVTAYNPTTMRMLGVDAEGHAAFVTSDISYLPANKAYLKVDASTPATLRIVTEEEYQTLGIHSVTADDSAVSPRRRGVFTLNGQRVGDTPDGLASGVYIVNGKKTVVK